MITLKNSFIFTECPEFSSGTVKIQGVGEMQIAARLPENILQQIEDFYIAEYKKRMTIFSPQFSIVKTGEQP